MMREIPTKFDDLNRSFTQMEGLGQKVDQLDQRFVQLGHKVDRLDQRVGQLEEKVGTNHRDVTTKIAAVDQKVDGLSRKLSCIDYNAMARVDNSGSTKRNSELTVLLNVETSEEISDFPATLGEADQLNNAETTRILGELGFSTRGNVSEKK
ncbi:hypothetical protein ACHAPT_013037 [Fusarium lateritium]